MSSEAFWSFVLLAVPVVAAPGPSVIFAIGRTAVGGRRYGLLTVAGNAAGLWLQVLLVASGLGMTVSRSGEARTILALVGAAYLVWLGMGALRSSSALGMASHTIGPAPDGALRGGFLVGVSNPKSLLFLVALLPGRVDPAAGGTIVQMALLGAAFCLLALVLDSAWVLLAARARSAFATDARTSRWFTGAGGAALIALGGWLLLGAAA